MLSEAEAADAIALEMKTSPSGTLRINAPVTDWRALLHAAVSGYGIILGPKDVLSEEVKAGRLIQVLPDYESPSRPMHMLTPAGLRQTVKIRSFIQAVRQAFG